MPTETETPAATPGAPSPGTPPQHTPQNPSPNGGPSNPGEQMISKSEHEAVVAKARSDEKAKLYPELERLKAASSEKDEVVKALQSKLAEKEKALSDLREGRSNEFSSVNAELLALKEQNKKLEAAFENLADASAAKVRTTELKAYRDRKVAEASLQHFGDLVTIGDSEEEIDSSITVAKKKEDALVASATEKVRKELGAAVPSPVAPSRGGSGSPPTNTARDRESIARQGGDEYRKTRAALIQKAKEEAGLV